MITELVPSPSRSLINDFVFFKKFSARRALKELGPNDPKLNMRVAENLLTISTEQFVRKWNFDPITMKPTKGPFVWTPLPDLDPSPAPFPTKEQDPVSDACPRIPNLEYSQLEGEDSVQDTNSVDRGHVLPPTGSKKSYQKSKGSKRGVLPRRCPPASPKTRQLKITEFGRQRKRLNSLSKSEEELDSSPRKKILVESTIKS